MSRGAAEVLADARSRRYDVSVTNQDSAVISLMRRNPCVGGGVHFEET